MKKRYAIVGTGGRSEMYWDALSTQYRETGEVVALCDRNLGRLHMRGAELQARGVTVAEYLDSDFDRMIAECRPDCVIVTTQDSAHDVYICRAMELGCDVITEKPMTIDAQRCQQILDTQRRTGRQCRVTFNYRYSPHRTQVKDLLMSGVIGEIIAVDFHWVLNTIHGADYFRRWHRNKANSGGLLVHKATHHFDLVNWWLSAVPTTVYAYGDRRFYTPQTADRLGLAQRTERCLTCPELQEGHCAFALDLQAYPPLAELYQAHEQYDGYYRDRCVFSDVIDIEDTMHLAVQYDTGVAMSYSLQAFAPWEGYTIAFTGTKGRLEHKCEESVYLNGDGTVPGALQAEGTWTRIYPQDAPAYQVDIWQSEGGHGGGDALLLADLFSPTPAPDPYRRTANYVAGAYSILTGIAANQSIASGQPVQIDSLLTGIGYPDYTAMPMSVAP
ncbi:MAG TPA: Gfo/Idh/MocA family oxidoreductase [Armatimonadota bacterium]|jgi:predicted dehydrogenase